MDLISIGDIHGSPRWKEIIDRHQEASKIVCIGDYFDDYLIPFGAQLNNFRNLIEYKKANLEKMVLLMGNHDYHYLSIARQLDEEYSGYKPEYSGVIMDELESAIHEGLLQMCHVSGQHLFTHAGVTKTWCRAHSIDDRGDLEHQINSLFRYCPMAFRFTPGRNFSNSGDDVEQSPIWVRPKSLFRDTIDKFTQVVGHTSQRLMNKTYGICFIDTIRSAGEYFGLEDGREVALDIEGINDNRYL